MNDPHQEPQTSMTRLEQELKHLIRLCTREPWMNDRAHLVWKNYSWAKAKSLASDPELESLPALLTAAMRTNPSTQSETSR